MKLSPNFYLAEFTASQTADRHGFKNIPSPAIKQNLILTAEGMEYVRKTLDGKPIFISSGYRNPEVNRKVGGVSSSHHLQGYAADFNCWKYGTPMDIINTVHDSGLQYDQLIQEGSWVHISFHPRMKQQTLIAHFGNRKTTEYTTFQPSQKAQPKETQGMQWILDRLKEPSTWAGLATILGSIGVAISPELVIQIGVAVTAVIGAIQMLRKEKSDA